MQTGARVLRPAAPRFRQRALAELDAQMLALNASPGGAAVARRHAVSRQGQPARAFREDVMEQITLSFLPAAPSAAKLWQAS
jgi:hypothetical protein